MIIALVLAVTFATGVDARRLVLLGVAVHLPLVAAGLIALHWYRERADHSSDPALFCEGVASELRAGATLRDALTTSAVSVGAITPSVGEAGGLSASEVAAEVAETMPSIAREIEHTVIAAGRSGSDAATLFDEIGSLAIAQAEIRREVKMATAPGVATALVLVGAPVVYLIGQLESGGLAEHVSSPQQRVVTLLGLGLFSIGLGLACLVLWRASR